MSSQRGSALVLVLMTVAALLIVGVSLVSASTVEFRSAINHSHSTQAFYVAEAGLNWARREVMRGDIILPASTVTPNVVYSSPAFGGTSDDLEEIGELHITVTRTATGWDLISQGERHLARRSVSWQITEQLGAGGGGALNRHHVSGIVSIGGSSEVEGNINATSWDAGTPSRVDGTLTHVPAAEFASAFPRVTMALPSGLNWRGAYETTKDNTPPFPGSGQFSEFTVNHDLDISVPGSQDVVIRVGTLNVSDKGSIRITGNGTGSVVFHVDNAISLDGKENVNHGGSAARLRIFHHGSSDVKLTGQVVIVGSLITNTANIEISGNAAVHGHILTNSTSVKVGKSEHNNNTKKSVPAALLGQVLYAPNAHLELQGNDFFNGVVVVKQLSGTGNSLLNLDTSFVMPVDTFATNLRRFTFANWNQRR